jgi:hypothetical protein
MANGRFLMSGQFAEFSLHDRAAVTFADQRFVLYTQSNLFRIYSQGSLGAFDTITISAAGVLECVAAQGGISIKDRSTSTRHMWYGTGDTLRLWNGSSDIMTIANAGGIGINTGVPSTNDIIYARRDHNSWIYSILDNRSTGTSAFCAYVMRNGTPTAQESRFGLLGTGFTGSGAYIANGAFFETGTGHVGGFSILARATNSAVRFYTDGTGTEHERIRVSNVGTEFRNASATVARVAADGRFFPVQAPTVSAPTYAIGAMYFDTTLNKLRIGGALGWETVTSV